MSLLRHLRLLALSSLALLAMPSHALQGKVVATGVRSPVFVTAPKGDQRLFIVSKAGVISVVVRGRTSTYLDISTLGGSNGVGLLGMAFDPKFAQNGRFYIDYFDQTLSTVIARYTVTPPSSNRVDPATRQTILTVPQRIVDGHKAGWIGFRSGDNRNLYITTGDGGAENDPDNNAQNGAVLLGKMLRIDVSGVGANYAIPADNPFVGSSDVREEIWALGLRNPFRPSFDRLTGDFWIADVGQDTREEINFEAAGDPGGHNYGWRLREGKIKTPGGIGGNKPGLTGPVFDYPHMPLPGSLGDSVTGGYVYRGPTIPEADGRYFFGDYVSNRVFSFAYGADGRPTEGREETTALLGGTGLAGLASFGEDGQGRLYAIGFDSGVIVLMCPSTPAVAGSGIVPDQSGQRAPAAHRPGPNTTLLAAADPCAAP